MPNCLFNVSIGVLNLKQYFSSLFNISRFKIISFLWWFALVEEREYPLNPLYETNLISSKNFLYFTSEENSFSKSSKLCGPLLMNCIIFIGPFPWIYSLPCEELLFPSIVNTFSWLFPHYHKMAAIALGITNIQGRKRVDVMPATPIAFSGKQKLSQKSPRKPLVFKTVSHGHP